MPTDKEWNAAHDNVKKVLERFINLIGAPDYQPCIQIALIHNVLVQYNLGVRTREVFDEMVDFR